MYEKNVCKVQGMYRGQACAAFVTDSHPVRGQSPSRDGFPFRAGEFLQIFRAIYDIGREDARQDIIRITPLEVPDFVPADTLSDMKVREMEEFFNQFNK